MKRKTIKTTKPKATRRAKRDTVLLMRTCGAHGESYGSFRWPLKVGARVEAKDWNGKPECGCGLHGLLWGQGDGGLLNWDKTAKWLIVEADLRDVVEIDGAKAKCRVCVVRYVGDKDGAVAYMMERAPETASILGAARAVGNHRAAVVGDSGQATAGDRGQATAGNRGQARSGEKGLLCVLWWDNKADRYRATVGYVGEDGIKPDTFYHCDEAGKLVEVTP